MSDAGERDAGERDAGERDAGERDAGERDAERNESGNVLCNRIHTWVFRHGTKYEKTR